MKLSSSFVLQWFQVAWLLGSRNSPCCLRHICSKREREIFAPDYLLRDHGGGNHMMSGTGMMRDSMKIFGRLGVFGKTIFGRPKSLQNLPKWFRGHRRFGWGWVCTIFCRCASVRISAYNCEHMRIFAHYPHHSAFAASAWQSQVLALYENEKLWNHKIFRQALNLSIISSLSQSRPQPNINVSSSTFGVWLSVRCGCASILGLCFTLGCATISAQRPSSVHSSVYCAHCPN